jgi:hypothetical protein
MVVGDNPDELMARYDMSREVEPYVKFKYKDREKMQKNAIKVMKEIVANPKLFNMTDFQSDAFKNQLAKIEALTPFEYYSMVTAGLYYNEDGDAMSDENEEGKWRTYRLGKNFSVPLKLLDGTETYQARNKDIDWSEMHMTNDMVYRRVWRMVVEKDEPQNEEERAIYENMRDKDNYFSNFDNEDDYATYNTSYWNFAYLDKDGWKALDEDGVEQFEWISKYYYRFVENLDPDALVTIYECTRDSE